jgi:hypothetical protein
MPNALKRRYKVVATFASVAAIAFIWLAVGPPVLVRLKDPSAVDPADGLLTVFNPFRDRTPERAAETFLRALQVGRCASVMETLPERMQGNTCDREASYPLLRWRLIDREEEPLEIRLHYKVWRRNYPNDIWGNAWLVTRRGNSQHGVVQRYEAWY